jgi:hypothetical protein
MTKQPTRLANFQIPREPAGKVEDKINKEHPPMPAFLQMGQGASNPAGDPALRPAPVPPAMAAAEPVTQPEAVKHPEVAVPPAPPPAPAPPALPVPVPAAPPVAVAVPQPMPRPVEEPRRQIGARVPVSLAERLRTYMFVSRESQQDAVEAALDAYLKEKGF